MFVKNKIFTILFALALVFGLSISFVYAGGFLSVIKGVFNSNTESVSENINKLNNLSSNLTILQFAQQKAEEEKTIEKSEIAVENKVWSGFVPIRLSESYKLLPYKAKDGTNKWCVGIYTPVHKQETPAYAYTGQSEEKNFGEVQFLYLCQEDYKNSYELWKDIKDALVVGFTSDDCKGYKLENTKTINYSNHTIDISYRIQCYVNIDKAFEQEKGNSIEIVRS